MMSHLSMGKMVDVRKRETKRILIIDDEPMIPMTLDYAMSSEAVKIVAASHFEIAEAAQLR